MDNGQEKELTLHGELRVYTKDFIIKLQNEFAENVLHEAVMIYLGTYNCDLAVFEKALRGVIAKSDQLRKDINVNDIPFKALLKLVGSYEVFCTMRKFNDTDREYFYSKLGITDLY